MKKKAWYILIPCLLLVLGAVGWLLFRKGPGQAEPPALPYGEMREGDLAFRTGSGLYATVLNLDPRKLHYSHIGILVQKDGSWHIVHAVPGETEGPDDFERVKAEPVEAFFAPERASHGLLVHTGLAEARRLCDTALRYARDSVRFDGSFDLEDTAEVYCTELVYRLFLAEGMDLSEGRRSYVNLPLLSGKGCLAPEDLLHFSGNECYFSY